jgi:DNA gyrase subunit A
VAVRRVDPEEEILMVSRAGLTVRFSEEDVRGMGRDTTGVRGMDVGPGGEVIAMDVAGDEQFLLVVTRNGYGKRTQVADYRKTTRGAKGVKTIQQTEAKASSPARWSSATITSWSSFRRTAWCSGSRSARSGRSAANAQGFRLMNIRDEDAVSARRPRGRIRLAGRRRDGRRPALPRRVRQRRRSRRR